MQIIKVLGNGETLPEDPELSGLLFGSAEADLAIGEQKPSVITAVYSDGGTFDVSDSATYASWNPEIATVDDRGLLTGLSAGSTVITAGYGGMEAQLIVHVTDGTQGPNPVNGQFYLDSEDYSLSIGSELDIQAWFADEYGNARLVNGETEFTIADTAIATIDEQGFMTGLTPGRTTLTAVYQGRSYTSTVLVVRPYVPAEIPEN
nr:Ig-like domain-containing protein [Paenibacillus sp. Marseille-P2973]